MLRSSTVYSVVSIIRLPSSPSAPVPSRRLPSLIGSAARPLRAKNGIATAPPAPAKPSLSASRRFIWRRFIVPLVINITPLRAVCTDDRRRPRRSDVTRSMPTNLTLRARSGERAGCLLHRQAGGRFASPQGTKATDHARPASARRASRVVGQAARTVARKRATWRLRCSDCCDRSEAEARTWLAAAPVSSAAFATLEMLVVTSPVPTAA